MEICFGCKECMKYPVILKSVRNKRGQFSLFKMFNFSKRSLFWPFPLSHSTHLLTSLILVNSAVQTWFLYTYGSSNQCLCFPCRNLFLPPAVACPCSGFGFILKSAFQREKQKYAQDLIFFLLFFSPHCNLDLKIILWIKSAKIQYQVGKHAW